MTASSARKPFAAIRFAYEPVVRLANETEHANNSFAEVSAVEGIPSLFNAHGKILTRPFRMSTAYERPKPVFEIMHCGESVFKSPSAFKA